MITEDYVSFGTAKRLKEKGFDECCHVKYKYVKEFDGYLQTTEYVDADFEKYYYPCPTLQMAMKWLREAHKMFIQVELYSKYENYCFELFHNTHRLMVEHREVYSTYEEACEAAIKYCLEKLF